MSQTFTASGTRLVPAGSTFRLYDVPANASIAVHPGGAGTMNVRTMIDQNGVFMEWPAGAVSASTQDLILGPLAVVEFVAAGADGKAEWRY